MRECRGPRGQLEGRDRERSGSGGTRPGSLRDQQAEARKQGRERGNSKAAAEASRGRKKGILRPGS